MRETDFLSKSKVYKLKLKRVQPTIFGDYEESDQRELFIKAMENDLHKVEPLVFEHPKNKKPHKRRIMLCPANGNTLMVVGEFRNPMDFVYVIIVLNSKRYKHPYMVVENYTPQFRNPDTVAQMVANAYNRVLEKSGVQVVFEPWNNNGNPIMYLKDGWESYNIELFKIQGRNLVRKGYEDALEVAKKEKMEAQKPPVSYKSENVKDHIVKGDVDRIVGLLHELIDGQKSAKDIARPVRWLCDHGVFHEGRLPYKAFLHEFPEVEEYISVSRYNYLINQNCDEYKVDIKYQSLDNIFDFIR